MREVCEECKPLSLRERINRLKLCLELIRNFESGEIECVNVKDDPIWPEYTLENDHTITVFCDVGDWDYIEYIAFPDESECCCPYESILWHRPSKEVEEKVYKWKEVASKHWILQ